MPWLTNRRSRSWSSLNLNQDGWSSRLTLTRSDVGCTVGRENLRHQWQCCTSWVGWGLPRHPGRSGKSLSFLSLQTLADFTIKMLTKGTTCYTLMSHVHSTPSPSTPMRHAQSGTSRSRLRLPERLQHIASDWSLPITCLPASCFPLPKNFATFLPGRGTVALIRIIFHNVLVHGTLSQTLDTKLQSTRVRYKQNSHPIISYRVVAAWKAFIACPGKAYN